MDITGLENWLWEAACSIRGPLDAPKYKDYILPLLFYKRLSDVYADELRDEVTEWAARIGVAVTRLRVRSMRTKWASCSTRGTLTLSEDLLTLPRDLVDYVICHDLGHLRISDHGQGFQALMGCHMPDWQERRRRLARWVIADGEE